MLVDENKKQKNETHEGERMRLEDLEEEKLFVMPKAPPRIS